MARLPGPAKRVPWAIVLQFGLRAGQELRERWNRLSEREQREATRIMRKSRGRLGNVTPGERAELRRLASKALGLGR